MEERHMCRRKILSSPETPSEKENAVQRRAGRLAMLSIGQQSPKSLTPIDYERVQSRNEPSPKPYRKSSGTEKILRQTFSLPINDAVMREHNGVVLRKHKDALNGKHNDVKMRKSRNRSRSVVCIIWRFGVYCINSWCEHCSGRAGALYTSH